MSTSPHYMKYDTAATLYGGVGKPTQRAYDFFGRLGYPGTLHDRETLYMTLAGYTGTLYDKWYAYLGDLGYTGTIRDRFRSFSADGFASLIIIPQSSPSTFLGVVGSDIDRVLIRIPSLYGADGSFSAEATVTYAAGG